MTDTEPRIDWTERLEAFLSTYVHESALWPVLFAVMAHVVVGIAAGMIHLVRDRSPFAGAALCLCLWPSASLVRRAIRTGRPGWTVVVSLTWIASAALAWGADRVGAY